MPRHVPASSPPTLPSAPTPPGQFAQSYTGGTGGAAHLLRHRGSPSAAPSRLRARFASRPPARPGRETRPASPDGAGAGRRGRTRQAGQLCARGAFKELPALSVQVRVSVPLGKEGREGGKMEGEGEGREGTEREARD